jgi:hypothetical protein
MNNKNAAMVPDFRQRPINLEKELTIFEKLSAICQEKNMIVLCTSQLHVPHDKKPLKDFGDSDILPIDYI